MGPCFCLRPQPPLNLIKALLTHYNKAERPLGAFPFQFHLQKQRETGQETEILYLKALCGLNISREIIQLCQSGPSWKLLNCGGIK